MAKNKGIEEKKPIVIPSLAETEKERERLRYKRHYNRALLITIYSLITAAALAVLVATLWLPVLRIYGNSMEPTLADDDIVVTVKGSEYKQGDIIAFYYNNKILVKRVIATEGDLVDISESGVVSVNGTVLDEPYVDELALGECNIELPYQVPDSRIFVMGDHRSVSIDSRNTTVGCIAEEQVVGRLVLCLWPVDQFEVY